ncbi:MAG: DUF2723 domain-containing protein [Anaerolineae bacterium]|nr:DUF2723 domain-containing protein [Anaerolineae bacterium]
MQNVRTVRRYMPAVAGICIFLLYLLTMPQGLTADLGGSDGGELASAVYTRGLVHPPGYPTYLLLAQSVWLIPLKSFAYRLNIFSAVCAAGATALLAGMVSKMLQRDSHLKADDSAYLAGALAALGLGCTALVWTQAVIVEVYTLAALWCVVLLALALWADRSPTSAAFTRRLVFLAAAAGLGLGSHYMTGLMAGTCLLYLVIRDYKRFLSPGTLLLIPGFLLGLLVFAYLPLRAGAVPISNWGDPRSLDRLISVLRAEVYADRVDWRAGLNLARLASLVRVLVEQIGVPGVICAGVGASLLWDSNRPLAVIGGMLVLVDLALTSSYFSADILPYLYPALIVCWTMAGVGWYLVVHQGLRNRVKHPVWYGVLYGVAVLVLVLPLVYRGGREVRTATTAADAFGRTVVEDAPEGSVIFSNGNAEAFSVRYAVLVSVRRDDIVPVNEWTLWLEWYRADLSRVLAERRKIALDLQDVQNTLEMIDRLPDDTPVIFSYNPNLPTGYHVEVMENGMAYRLVERPTRDDNDQ